MYIEPNLSDIVVPISTVCTFENVCNYWIRNVNVELAKGNFYSRYITNVTWTQAWIKWNKIKTSLWLFLIQHFKSMEKFNSVFVCFFAHKYVCTFHLIHWLFSVCHFDLCKIRYWTHLLREIKKCHFSIRP